NQCAYDAVDLTPAEAVGKRYDELMPFAHRADVVARVAAMLKRSAAGEIVRSELPVLLAGGRVAIMDCMSSPIRDLQGHVVRVLGPGVECKDRKDAEASLLRLNRALRMRTRCNQILARVTDESALLNSI